MLGSQRDPMSVGGFFYLLIATLSYGALQAVDKVVLNAKVDPVAYTISRVIISMLFLGILVLVRNRRSFISVFKPVHWKDLFIIGVLASGIGLLFQMIGLSYTTATNMSIILAFTAPLTTLFAFFILKERISQKFIAASLLMLLGVLLIFTKNPVNGFGLGDILIVIAIIGYAYSNVYAKKTMGKLPTSTVTLGRLFFGSLSLALLFPFLGFSFSSLLKAPFLVVLGGAIFGIRMLAYYKGIEIEGASTAATFLLFSPVVTVGLAASYLNESLTTTIILGMMLVIIGGLLLTKAKPAI